LTLSLYPARELNGRDSAVNAFIPGVTALGEPASRRISARWSHLC
jgi:hypothetical protein